MISLGGLREYRGRVYLEERGGGDGETERSGERKNCCLDVTFERRNGK